MTDATSAACADVKPTHWINKYLFLQEGQQATQRHSIPQMRLLHALQLCLHRQANLIGAAPLCVMSLACRILG